jgi:hypothetical protein
MKHAIRWVAVGAGLAYVFDPEHGRDRREKLRSRAMQLVERAKGSAVQLRADADEVFSTAATSDSTSQPNGRSATPARSGAPAS